MLVTKYLEQKTHSEEERVCAIHICIHNGRVHMPILEICEEMCAYLTV